MERKRKPRQDELQVEQSVRLYVRRGAIRRFDRLKRDTQHLPVEVTWDRRKSGTDGTRDHTLADRRQSAPFTWGSADFVVVIETYDEG